jgi:FHS family Na+ dependent glucose MFS transporter 1
MNKQIHAIRNTIGYYAMFACIGLSVGISGPTIPALAGQTNSSIGAIGGIFLAGPIGGVIGTYLGGRFFDRIKHGHMLLGCAQLSSALMIFLIPLAPFYWMLIAVTAFLGFSNGFVNTGSNTFLMWTHRDKAAPFMNALHFFFGLGAFGAPFIFAQLISHGGNYRDAYWIMAVLVFITGVGIFLLGECPHPEHKDEPSSEKIRMIPYLPIIIAAMFYLFFYVGAEISFGQWIFTYSTKLAVATDKQAAYLTSGFWFAFTIGRLVSIPVATQLKPAKIISVSLSFCIAIIGLMLLLPVTLPVLWVISCGLGFFMAPIWPSGYTMAGQSIRLTAQMSSIILLGDVIGGMILPAAMGHLLERYSSNMMPQLVLISLAMTCAAFIFIVRSKKSLRC